ncbi:MAG: MBL fold metallo-hydrolase [Solirubrobacterales bacterium]|nr:MBL fold metallo-hydrolase [Solirubrobacterales bacterium]
MSAVTVGLAVALAAWGGRDGVAPPPAGVLRVTALDVGQGDATLLQAGGSTVLVDAGGPDGPVVRRLRRLGVRRIDVALATHGSADHVGGLPAVIRALPVGIVLDGRDGDRSPVPGAIDPAAREKGVRVVPVRAGEAMRAGPIELRFLWPPPTPPLPGEDPNLRAVVARASAYGASVLLTADAESPVLDRIALDPVDVLKVSHHGSADAGLPGVLERLRPRAAMIEVGRHNTYGHPAPSTLEALATVPEVLRTDEDGTVGIELGSGAPRVVRP